MTPQQVVAILSMLANQQIAIEQLSARIAQLTADLDQASAEVVRLTAEKIDG